MADDKKFTEDAYEQTLIALFRTNSAMRTNVATRWSATIRSLSIVPIWSPRCDGLILNCQPMQWMKESSKSPTSASVL